MSRLSRPLVLATLLLTLAPTLQAQSAGEFRKAFGRWAEQSERILAAQARDAEPRAILREALQEQRDSLAGLAEPMLGTVQPIKMQFMAAFVLDRANQHRATLAPAQFGQLLALSESMADHCHKAYPQPGTACTNEKYWTLKGLLAIARAKQPGADAAAELAQLPVLLKSGVEAAAREPFTDARIESACSLWWFSLRVQLEPETFAGGSLKGQAPYFEALLSQLAPMLSSCDEAMLKHRSKPGAAALDRLADALARASDALQRNPAADNAAVRAAAQAQRER